MGEVVNLNQFRKQLEKARKARRSAENKAKAGRSKDDRARVQHENERRRADAEGNRLDNEPPDETPSAS